MLPGEQEYCTFVNITPDELEFFKIAFGRIRIEWRFEPAR